MPERAQGGMEVIAGEQTASGYSIVNYIDCLLMRMLVDMLVRRCGSSLLVASFHRHQPTLQLRVEVSSDPHPGFQVSPGTHHPCQVGQECSPHCSTFHGGTFIFRPLRHVVATSVAYRT